MNITRAIAIRLARSILERSLGSDLICESVNRLTLSTRDMGDYIVRAESVTCEFADQPVEIESAYTQDGLYIGSEESAKQLAKLGIKPELASADHNVCSIGFCAKEQKYFGWSHRAIMGFGIGDLPVNCAPMPMSSKYSGPAKTLADCKKYAIEFAESVS